MVATHETERIKVESPIHPGRIKWVDADMYAAMKRAFLRVLPTTEPGLTLAEIEARLLPRLPEKLFPQGAKAGWWSKTVQLDLEAKGVVVRHRARPIRLRKTSR